MACFYKLKTMQALVLIGTLFLASCSETKQDDTDKEGPPKTTNGPATTAKPDIDFFDPDQVNAKYATLRKLNLAETKTPPLWRPIRNEDIRSVRNYPEQPPVIPHKIDGYQLDRRHNTCLDCHRRVAVKVSQAPMVSITHFMDRDGQSLASISPRRYFCTQCHVPQRDVNELVENTFIDVDTMIQAEKNAVVKKE